MPAYSKIPKIVNAINKGVVRAVAGKKGGMKAEVKKKYPKTPKPTGMKGRGTTSTSVAKPKSAVKVLPRKTAPKSGLEGRGNKFSAGYKSDRAANAYMNKAEGRWAGEYLTISTGLKGPVEKSIRGMSKKKAAKETAMLKEANKKQPIKINSQQNLKKKGK
jgi:hypothetical protein